MRIEPSILFWGGTVLMGLSIGGTVVSAAVLRISGRRLRLKLENEYGKKRR